MRWTFDLDQARRGLRAAYRANLRRGMFGKCWMWTEEEIALLRRHPDHRALLARKLPRRTPSAIEAKLRSLGLLIASRRPRHPAQVVEEIRRQLAAGKTCKAVAAEVGLTSLQVQNIATYRRMRPKRPSAGPHPDPLVESIRQRAKALNISLAELDRALGVKNRFCGRQKIPDRLIPKALKVLGGQLAVRWQS